MFIDEARTIFCIAAGCLLAYWAAERIEELRAEADQWEIGIREKAYQEGWKAGRQDAEWNESAKADPRAEPQPASA